MLRSAPAASPARRAARPGHRASSIPSRANMPGSCNKAAGSAPATPPARRDARTGPPAAARRRPRARRLRRQPRRAPRRARRLRWPARAAGPRARPLLGCAASAAPRSCAAATARAAAHAMFLCVPACLTATRARGPDERSFLTRRQGVYTKLHYLLITKVLVRGLFASQHGQPETPLRDRRAAAPCPHSQPICCVADLAPVLLQPSLGYAGPIFRHALAEGCARRTLKRAPAGGGPAANSLQGCSRGCCRPAEGPRLQLAGLPCLASAPVPARARPLRAGRLQRRAPRARLRERRLQRGDAAGAFAHLRAGAFAGLAVPSAAVASRTRTERRDSVLVTTEPGWLACWYKPALIPHVHSCQSHMSSQS